MPRRRTPLREQAFRIGTLMAGPVIALLVFAGLAATGIFEPVSPLVIVIVLVAMVVLAAIGGGIGMLVGNRLVGESIELAVRAPGDKWRHARADVSPGRMRLQKYRWQLRIPAGEPMDLDVDHVGSEERKPKPSQWWSMNPQIRIVDVQTPQGTFEMGALPSHLSELRQRLRG